MSGPQTASGRALLDMIVRPTPDFEVIDRRTARNEAELIRAIEAEAIATERARLRREIEGLPVVSVVTGPGPSHEGFDRVTVLALLSDHERQP